MYEDTEMLNVDEFRSSSERHENVKQPKAPTIPFFREKRTDDAGLNEVESTPSKSKRGKRHVTAAKEKGAENVAVNRSSSASTGKSTKKADKQDLGEKWLSVTLNGKESHPWDPTAYPPPGPEPEEPRNALSVTASTLHRGQTS